MAGQDRAYALDQLGWQNRPDEDVVDTGFHQLDIIPLRALIDERDDRNVSGQRILLQRRANLRGEMRAPTAIEQDGVGLQFHCGSLDLFQAACELRRQAFGLQDMIDEEVEIDILRADQDKGLRLTHFTHSSIP